MNKSPVIGLLTNVKEVDRNRLLTGIDPCKDPWGFLRDSSIVVSIILLDWIELDLPNQPVLDSLFIMQITVHLLNFSAASKKNFVRPINFCALYLKLTE